MGHGHLTLGCRNFAATVGLLGFEAAVWESMGRGSGPTRRRSTKVLDLS